MNVATILKMKGREVVSSAPTTSLLDIAEQLAIPDVTSRSRDSGRTAIPIASSVTSRKTLIATRPAGRASTRCWSVASIALLGVRAPAGHQVRGAR